MDQKYSGLKIENQICFPLYAASRELIKTYKPFLDEIGLTYTQYLVMLVLWEHNSMTVKKLGEILYLDSGTLTPLLKKMEQNDFISRKRSLEDERNLIVSLTNEGRNLQKQAAGIPANFLKNIAISKEEMKALYTILYKLLDNSPNSRR